MVTCLDCGTSITGPDGEGMTSNEVVILELVRPVASAMMTTPEEHSASIPNAM